jgi:hypothetical protein
VIYHLKNFNSSSPSLFASSFFSALLSNYSTSASGFISLKVSWNSSSASGIFSYLLKELSSIMGSDYSFLKILEKAPVTLFTGELASSNILDFSLLILERLFFLS